MNHFYFQKLTDLLKQSALDAILICPSEELSFLTGFSPVVCERFQGLFVKRDGSAFYFCNLLTGDEAVHALPESIPVFTWFDNETMTEVLLPVLENMQLTGKAIGVNSSAKAFHLLDIAKKSGCTFQNAVSLLEEVRICKTAEELDCLRKAASIADEAYCAILPRIHAGLLEGDVRDMLISEMERRGGTDAGALVASGPNAGYPHYCQYSRQLATGDCLIMDFGCLFHGLHSDMTRTVFIGSVPERQRQLYQLLLKAQLAAEASAVEGAFIPDIDQQARTILSEENVDRYFTTRIGHGIGYMTHEAPYIAKWNARKLEKGMCFSIEPGIYVPGEFGMRIEDIVVINLEGQREVLNQAPKELFVTAE